MTKEIIRDALKIGFPFIAVMALVLGTALPVLADNKSKPVSALPPVQGEVISVASDNSTFVIQNGSQQQVTITIDSNTKYYMVPTGKASAAVNSTTAKDKIAEKKANKREPGQFQTAELKDSGIAANCGTDPNWLGRYGKQAQFSDIQVGDRVIAWVKTADNLATKVLIIKGPVVQKVKGTITAISDSSITITPANGTAVTLIWDLNTRFMLKGLISVQTGQYAAAVYNRNTMTAQTVEVQAT
ncbi:MAG: DUF5666 domain-containing protein, partial [Dehalococcoidia bacterium]|nr:DUF5666 domain-containing protein [Dehalococcoidia bacterium]